MKRLSEWGAKTIFGYPGDGITAARATFTGKVGVWLATSGPGMIHLLNG